MIAIFLTLFLAALSIIVVWKRVGKKNPKLPPGPWFRVPLLGQLPFLGANPHQTFMRWSSTYGPVISVQFGTFPAVVINDGKILREAFGSPALAGRPGIKILDDWSGRRGVAFGDGPHSREQRRFALKSLPGLTKASESMHMVILDEVENLIEQLDAAKGKPVGVHKLFNRNVINSLLTVLTSKKLDPHDSQGDEMFRSLTSALQNKGLLQVLGMFVPMLCSYFPDAVGYSTWIKLANDIKEFLNPLILERLRTLTPGQPRDVLDMYVEKVTASKDDTSSSFHDAGIIVDSFRDFLSAGMEATSSQLEWIIHFLAKYPSMQDKLLVEVDSVLPNNQLPSPLHLPRLPHTEAFIHETLRISSSTPFGNFHSVLEDKEIAGYHIPKGTLVIGNLYAVNNDPEVWQSPHLFQPERFITQDGKFSTGDNPVIAFGTGQRSCVGEGFARSQLFLFVVRILQNFKVTAVSDIRSANTFSAFVAPQPFQAVFQRRN